MTLDAEAHREYITEAIMQLPNSQQFLTPGRLVVVKSDSVCIHHIWFSLHTSAVFLRLFLFMLFYYFTNHRSTAIKLTKNCLPLWVFISKHTKVVHTEYGKLEQTKTIYVGKGPIDKQAPNI